MVTGFGIFDSRIKFKNQKKTSPRKVSDYEIDFFLQGGGISILNSQKYLLGDNTIPIAKPTFLLFSITKVCLY
jgi:hypothetical protein